MNIDNAETIAPDPAAIKPFIPPMPGATKQEIAAALRAEALRREDIASCMRFGKARACEFAYMCGLLDAARVLEGEAFHLHCPISPHVVMDSGDFGSASNQAVRESIDQARELVAAGHDVCGADWDPKWHPLEGEPGYMGASGCKVDENGEPAD